MTCGYIVVEQCEEWEQILCLETGPNMPDAGIMVWPGEGFPRHIFANRKEARAAINRTHHYARAFEFTNMPERQNCKIQRVLLPKESVK